MLRKVHLRHILVLISTIITCMLPFSVFASITDGTIQVPDQYAWSENAGWINFAAPQGDIHVTDYGLSGYAWDANMGWINLNPASAGVKNDTQGNLSGYAWSEGAGYINFSGVTIDSSGRFHGQAQGTNYGKINFDCASCNVTTDYRPANSAARNTNTGGIIWLSGATTSPRTFATITPPVIYVLPPVATTTSLPTNIKQQIIQQEQSPATASSSSEMSELELLLQNFPGFKNILNQLGVNTNNISSTLSKIANVNFTLPSFLDDSLTILNKLGITIPTNTTGLSSQNLNTQSLPSTGLSQVGLYTQNMASGSIPNTGLSVPNFSVLKNVPLAQLPIQITQSIPNEVVFARSGNENIDLPITLNVTQDGQLNKTITATANQRVTLLVKPDPTKTVVSVTGYVVFRNTLSLNTNPIKDIQVSQGLPANIASVLAANSTLKSSATTQPSSNDLMVVGQFTYAEQGHTGIYTATITMPSVNGDYEIVTAIQYHNESVPKVLRLVTLIDPEGYIYQAAGQNETRIRNALITLYTLNSQTNAFDVWDARSFAQKNPQLTDQTGSYSFLVPEGTYYFIVQATGYNDYTSQVFNAQDGDSLHENIAMTPLSVSPWIYVLELFPIILFVYLVRRYYLHLKKNWEEERNRQTNTMTKRE